jgi:hypothetical protein
MAPKGKHWTPDLTGIHLLTWLHPTLSSPGAFTVTEHQDQPGAGTCGQSKSQTAKAETPLFKMMATATVMSNTAM